MKGIDGSSEAPAFINLKIKYSPNGREVYCNEMRNRGLRNLMLGFCERLALRRSDVLFVYKGHYVSAEATPNQLEMEDGDVIDAISYKPRNPLAADAMICVTVHNGHRQGMVCFTIKKSSTLSNLITAYCNRCSLHENCSFFLFNGRRLINEHTAEELGMEDGDEIHVMPRQPLCGSCRELP